MTDFFDTPEALLQLIAQTIFDKKGSNILALDVREISALTNYVIIAEGNVDRHVVAIGKAIMEALDEKGVQPAYVEGLEHGDWVVLDYVDVMVHLFLPAMRDRYRLEELWRDGHIVDIPIETGPLVKDDRYN